MFDFDADLEDDISELEGAEDFLNYFAIPFDQTIVHAYRLHILQRFHDDIVKVATPPEEESERKALYTKLLTKAYQTFVDSDPKTEKVLQIYKSMDQDAAPAFVPLSDLIK
ncbi:nitrogenase-stabilizing/protective protein NifW [Magnetovibrio blakemorei]|uniref:Nitrogenase-stabilizing/protective protein NifW n=1 Tax=Magnetovibrio blakemorei TaxID=28181 RepID=A0A1E5Q6L3_9PROT|nr:nitrogenase-stabilizing/protective protein NifW [Magnetovibrio blakemorei]OEJ66263.1 nitrogen fixation protein NifW [Magnetovibrio blakemorei]